MLARRANLAETTFLCRGGTNFPFNSRYFSLQLRPLSVDSWDGGFSTRVLAAVGRKGKKKRAHGYKYKNKKLLARIFYYFLFTDRPTP